MKKIKVKAIFGAWQGYQELANYPPKDVEYIGISEDTKEGKYYENKKIKEFLTRTIQRLKIPRIFLFLPGKYDLIHSSRGIMPLQIFSKKPWVMDIEHVHSFFGLDPNLIKVPFWKKFIEKRISSEDCKGILCHCEATRQAFFHYLDCSKFKDKIKVIHPASHEIDLKKEKHNKIRILCILSLFEAKAGLQALKAFSKLEKKYKNIELWMKADVPENIKKKYNSKNIKYFGYFSNIITREELLKKFYSRCDIFLYPSMCDSFGYSMIDALVAGLPIVSTNLFAFPDIVKNGKNGFLIDIPGYDLKKDWKQHYPVENFSEKEEGIFVDNLVKNLEKLIKNKSLRKKMENENLGLISKGEFSIQNRNKKLKKIYEGAIK